MIEREKKEEGGEGNVGEREIEIENNICGVMCDFYLTIIHY